MVSYDFDKIVDRRNTDCLKHDFAVQRGRPQDVLPFWVADMDFPIAEEITDALVKRCQHGIFGYSEATDPYFDALQKWYNKHFHWQVQRPWLIKTPGVVFALAMAVKAFTEPGEGVLVQQPVYYPFTEVIRDNGREVVNSPLVLINGHYEMDFADLEQKLADTKVKLMFLCSPHNPVGRVWSEAELRKVGDLCLEYNVITVSDEIHSDFVWDDNVHTPFATLGKEYEQNCIVCTAPSKTFNLAGLQVSNIFIPNQKLRHALRKQIDAAGYSQLNTLGLVACQAAYTYGEEWLTQVKAYIRSNIAFVEQYLVEQLPQIKMLPIEGTYLVWLDCSALGMTAAEREQWLWHEAKLWLDGGGIFGVEGEPYERINVACPRATLLKGLEQLKAAVEGLKKE
ncbi:MAG: MalY/PatB family protein [Phascolarctobacterium sp.]|nr:MalY/PatB family protein [Phascolarctobacterium sp.]